MDVAKHVVDGVTVIELDGELDSSTAPDVHGRLGDLAPAGGRVLIDLSRTSYLSSAGLRVLLLVYRQAQAGGARLALVSAPPDVRQVMAATGFLDFFTVADSVADGVAALGKN